MEGTTYPEGTMIYKDSMDPTNTFVAQISMMTKTNDPMYADLGGWKYAVTGHPVSTAEELGELNQLSVENAAGCHGCHAKADNDSVFVSLTSSEDDSANGGDGNNNGQ